MPVRVVSSPFLRLRCVSCAQRVSDLEGPFFDFGSLDEAAHVELLEQDPQGKKQHHDDLLVCAGCVKRAASKLPGAEDVAAHHARELAAAHRERDAALRLASTFSSEATLRLNEALASSDQDPRGQSNMTLPSPETQAPPQLAAANEAVPADTPPDIDLDEVDLESMTVRQLRGLARERDIQVPADVSSKSALVDHISEALTAPEPA